MRDEEVDKVLQNASGVAPQVEPALLKRIADSINSSLRPVRPLPPTWVLTGGLALICAAVAVAAAACTGFYGIGKLGLWERVLIFSTLGILVWVAGKEFVSQLIPGSRRHLSVGAFLTIDMCGVAGRVCAGVQRLPHRPLHLRGGRVPADGPAPGHPRSLPELVAAPARVCGEFSCGRSRWRRARGIEWRDDVGTSLRQFPGTACSCVAHSGGARERGSRSAGGVGVAWAIDPNVTPR